MFGNYKYTMLLFDVWLGWVRFAHVSRGLGWVGSINSWVELGYRKWTHGHVCCAGLVYCICSTAELWRTCVTAARFHGPARRVRQKQRATRKLLFCTALVSTQQSSEYSITHYSSFVKINKKPSEAWDSLALREQFDLRK